MVFIKNDIIAKRLTELEPEYLECIFTELKISKKKWIIFVVYRPLPPKKKYGNLSDFF